jgi:hypothetical protein
MILESILAQVVPAMAATVAAQLAPDHVVPIKADPEGPRQHMTLVGAIVAILIAVESAQAGRWGEINPEQLVAAAAIVWGLLPRVHEIIAQVRGLCTPR